MKRIASTRARFGKSAATSKKSKSMNDESQPLIERLKQYVRTINTKSPVFLASAGVGLVIFLTFFFAFLRVGSFQDEGKKISTTSPTPFPTRELKPGRDYVPGQLIVKFKDGVTTAQINEVLGKYNATVKTTISGINSTVITIPVGQEKVISEGLSKESIVKYAELDHVARAMPNDTRFGEQYGLKNTGQSIKGNSGVTGADSKLEPAWEITKGAGVKISILDTGVDPSHPDLSSKLAEQKVFITNSIDDQYGHGTHVAGIAAAVTNNTAGIAGACPDCKIMVGKVLDDSGSGPYSVIAQGVTWSADNNAKVINLSLGGYDNDNTLREAVNYALGKGVVLVAAAGNDNQNRKFYPGGYDGVVTVAATDNKDKKASFSNYGEWVEVAAAGLNILSTFPTHSYVLQNAKGTALNYDYISGTSMATPLVSGVVGLIWTSPHGTSKDAVIDRLYATADQIGGTGTSWTKGRVNAQAAVGGVAVSPGPSVSPPVSISPSAGPTSGASPTGPAPTFVCGGSLASVCTSPTITQNPTTGPNPTIGNPTVTPIPDADECLDPRSAPEKIRDWVSGFIRKINNYIQLVLGNPQNPPPPPVPCIRQ
jgi:thermitase